jgi:LPS-assembly protein
VPYRDQTELPVFDTGLPDLNLVQLFRRNRYVGADRLSDANQVSFGVTSRMLDANDGRQFLSATFGQTYYFDTPRVTLPGETPPERKTSNFISQLELTAYRDWNINLGHEWNPELSESEKTELALQYRPANDKVINAGYRFRRDLIKQVDASVAWPVAKSWNVYARAVYSLLDDALIEEFAGLEYSSCCWKIRMVQRRYVSDRTGERDSSIALQIELKGLGNVGVPIDAFLQRSIRGYSRDAR